MENQRMVLDILAGTPRSVYTIFLLLVWLGVQRLSPRTVSIQRATLTPTVFIIWGVWSLLQSSVPLLLDWSLCAVLGIGLAVWLRAGADPPRIDRASGLLYQPGSMVPLIRNLSIFAAKYGLGIATALHPENRATLKLWSIAVSGVSAGYFFGWLLQLRRAWYHPAPGATADT